MAAKTLKELVGDFSILDDRTKGIEDKLDSLTTLLSDQFALQPKKEDDDSHIQSEEGADTELPAEILTIPYVAKHISENFHSRHLQERDRHEGTLLLRLESNCKKEANPMNNQRQVFTATMLLQRKANFHRNLVNIVKEHHKDFLSKLASPLSVPDDKLTRWHPKFALDGVPDIVAAPLPEPPSIKKYQTANDVLEHAKEKLLPRVTKALQNVAKKLTPTKENKITEKIKVPEASSKLLNGIPLSLLEKIRAKEAKKQEEAMMCNPADEKRTMMMKRLPDIMRIIRAHFITEKKPALPSESVNLKLVENYKSCISRSDVDAHLELLLKTAPDWITMVQIRKGKYLKIDKGKDLQSIVNKINTNFK